MHVLRSEVMNIFFDESGRNNDKPTTMGGLAIPQSVYIARELTDLTNKLKLKEGRMKLHWTDYTGHGKMREDITEAITVFSKFARYSKMTVINYNQLTLNQRKQLLDEDFSTLMVYTKIPERIFYGLLRNYGKDVFVKANIFIEEARMYLDLKLPERINEMLNTQSLYRGEQFSVLNTTMHPKNEMIGIELVDLILGIMRTIILNHIIPDGLTDEQLLEQKLKAKKKKNDLAVQLLRIPEFYSFLSDIQYYEWDSHKELEKVRFQDYLQLFTANHFREFTPFE